MLRDINISKLSKDSKLKTTNYLVQVWKEQFYNRDKCTSQPSLGCTAQVFLTCSCAYSLQMFEVAVILVDIGDYDILCDAINY